MAAGPVVDTIDGRRVLGSGTVDVEGDAVEVERPLQVYTRWYGFSLTFPEPEIWGRGR